MFQHRDPFGTESGCHGLTDSRVFPEEQGAARQDRDLLAAEPSERLCHLDRHHRRADDGQPLGDRVARQRLGGGPVGRVRKARDRRNRRARAGGDQAAVEAHLARAAVSDRHDQRMRVLESGLAAQHVDVRGAFQNTFVLGVAQFLDAALLLAQQPVAEDGGRCCRDAIVERAAPAQMSDVGSANHDLRRNAADIDASPADCATLD